MKLRIMNNTTGEVIESNELNSKALIALGNVINNWELNGDEIEYQMIEVEI